MAPRNSNGKLQARIRQQHWDPGIILSNNGLQMNANVGCSSKACRRSWECRGSTFTWVQWFPLAPPPPQPLLRDLYGPPPLSKAYAMKHCLHQWPAPQTKGWCYCLGCMAKDDKERLSLAANQSGFIVLHPPPPPACIRPADNQRRRDPLIPLDPITPPGPRIHSDKKCNFTKAKNDEGHFW